MKVSEVLGYWRRTKCKSSPSAFNMLQTDFQLEVLSEVGQSHTQELLPLGQQPEGVVWVTPT